MQSDKSSNKRIIKNSVLMYFRTLFVLVISLYSTRVVMRVLGVEDFGIYSVVAGFVTMFTFVNNSLANSVQRYYNYVFGKGKPEDAVYVYNASLFIHIVIGLLICIVVEVAGTWYIHNKLVLPIERMPAALAVFHACVVSLFFTLLNVPYSASVMAHEKMDYYAYVGIIDALLKLLIIIAIQFVGSDKLMTYGLLLCIVSVCDFLLYSIYARVKFSEIRLKLSGWKRFVLPIFQFSSWGVLGTLSALIREQGLGLVLNFYFGPVVNAARGVAGQVSGALNAFAMNIVTPARPQIIQSYASENYDRSYSLACSVSKYIFIFFYMFSMPLVFGINTILSIWLGDNVPEYTSWFVIILLISNNICMLAAPLSALVHANGNQRFYQITGSTTNLLCIVFAFVFIYIYKEPVFAFTATFFSIVLNTLFVYISVIRITSLSHKQYYQEVVKPIIKLIAFSLPFIILPKLFLNDGILQLLLECILSASLVLSITYYVLLKPSEKAEVNLILQKVRR